MLTVSVKELQSPSQDISASYLANIFKLLAEANGSPVSIPFDLSPPRSDFSPPRHAIWVNVLWFSSLVISLTCAMVATLVQQWTRRYIKITRSQYSVHGVHQQARIRAFFAEGLDKFQLPLVVDLLPTFVHLSVFLFFSGLPVFLYHLFGKNRAIFITAVVWVATGGFLYLCIFLMPIIRHDCPYYSPLSSLSWYLLTLIAYKSFKILRKLTPLGSFSGSFRKRVSTMEEHYRRRFGDGMQKSAEDFARILSPGIDRRTLVWILDTLDERRNLLDFREPAAFSDSQATNSEKTSEALIDLMHHTPLSDRASDQKQSQTSVRNSTANAADLPITLSVLQRVLYKDWTELLGCAEFGLLLTTAKYNGPRAHYTSNSVIATIIATADHDDPWRELCSRQLGISRDTLDGYLRQGNTVLLANCINICHRMIEAHLVNPWRADPSQRSKCLEKVTDFDVQDTLPELQYDFCRLWNKLIRMAENDERMSSLAIFILRHLRHIYIALHQGTDAAPTAFSASSGDYDDVLFHRRSYPLCNIPDHGTRPHETTHNQTNETDHVPAATYGVVIHPPTGVAALSHLIPGRREGYRRPPASRDVPALGASDGTIDFRAISSTASSHPLYTRAASTAISLQASPPSSSGTLPPSVAPATSPSSPTTVPDHTPAGLGSSSTSPPSKFDQSTSADISPVSPPANPNVVDTGLPTAVEASHPTAPSRPDTATDVSFGATSFHHDWNRSQ